MKFKLGKIYNHYINKSNKFICLGFVNDNPLLKELEGKCIFETPYYDDYTESCTSKKRR